MEKPLWKFTDSQGSFSSDAAGKINTLYFPLCNTAPFVSSLSPDLHGDIKTAFNSFLLEPVSRHSLKDLRSSRNFWVYIHADKAWSATGVARNNADIQKYDCIELEAGLLWHKVSRLNKKIGLKSRILSFVPASGEPVELALVTLENISGKPVRFLPTAAIPIFARSANNLHDHRQVTSLLQRIKKNRYGVIVRPTLSFDEAGHKKNRISYFVLGIGEDVTSPQYIWPTQEEFTGEAGDLESPEAVFKNLTPRKDTPIQGKEAMAGLKFRERLLKPGEGASYILILGITEDEKEINSLFKKFNTPDKVLGALRKTEAWWQKRSAQIKISTGERDFDNWVQWVNAQPLLRKIAGCSFLPDFDYGRGGRGWRDLWQDCLSLILNNPAEVRKMLIDNFRGVRIDGSNATIIGKKPGEFIADRNNIPRVWMDHGIWPLFTIQLYIHQSSDFRILLEETTYFKDRQLSRSKEQDPCWSPEGKNLLTTRSGKAYKGTVLEHLLVENLVQFFNVGEHNFILLEGADWNDGLDMARERGESLAFSSMYAQNLMLLAEIIEKLPGEKIAVLKEAIPLFDTLTSQKIDYSEVKAKRRLLERYFNSVKKVVTGGKISLDKIRVIRDLKEKSDWMYSHLRKNAWLKEGFFNGYCDNRGKKVEGRVEGIMRMTLTGQALPLLAGTATAAQAASLIKNTRRYLKDKKLGGFHLNTDFKKEQPDLGRAFSFVYGDKENGAFFNHMCVIYAYALYKQGYIKEGFEVLHSIYKMSLDTPISKIYPGLPEYFNAQGRGMYSYLTGSASWFIFTLLTQVFGVRGEYGSLVIEPKLTRRQFKYSRALSIKTSFAQRDIEIRFINSRKKEFGAYSIKRVLFNSQDMPVEPGARRFFMERSRLLSLSGKNNLIEIELD